MELLTDSLLKTIAYFDIFDHPLKKEEIKFFLSQSVKEDEISLALQQLLSQKIIYHSGDFYSLKSDASSIERRIKGKQYAEKRLKLASRVAAIISRFPYTRGIAISGSLSKDFANEKSDLDFFVITAANRLWISRTLLIIASRIANIIVNKDFFCLNYFIDEAALEIEEKNIFTAVEIATLLPKQGNLVFKNFSSSNKWVHDYLPNHRPKDIPEEEIRGFVKPVVEFMFKNKFGDALENWLLRFHQKRWKKLVAKNQFTKTGFHIGSLIATPHFCKPYPHHFQKKILTKLEERIAWVQSLSHKQFLQEKG